MTSTIAQYFLVTLCACLLASSFARAGDHGGEEATKKRSIASVSGESTAEGNALTVPNEEGEKLINTHKKLQDKLLQFRTGNISDSTLDQE